MVWTPFYVYSLFDSVYLGHGGRSALPARQQHHRHPPSIVYSIIGVYQVFIFYSFTE